MTDEAHVVPRHDLVDHATTDECDCGPTLHPIQRDDGSTGWMYVHHSLDGRESGE
jgi:hypothetical protein